MAEKRVSVVKLASELGVGIVKLQGLMHDLRIQAPNGSSLVAPKDVDRLRQWFENERRRTAEAQAAYTRQGNARVLDRYHDVHTPKRQQSDLPMPKFACACCGRNVGTPSPDLIELDADLFCPLCQSHHEVPDESPDRELERLRAHDADLRAYARGAWAAQVRYREKMKAAYRSRDVWRATFAETVLPHEPGDDGACAICHQPSPCPIWTAIEDTNQGIFREMDKLSALKERELELALYPDRVTDQDFEELRL